MPSGGLETSAGPVSVGGLVGGDSGVVVVGGGPLLAACVAARLQTRLQTAACCRRAWAGWLLLLPLLLLLLVGRGLDRGRHQGLRLAAGVTSGRPLLTNQWPRGPTTAAEGAWQRRAGSRWPMQCNPNRTNAGGSRKR